MMTSKMNNLLLICWIITWKVFIKKLMEDVLRLKLEQIGLKVTKEEQSITITFLDNSFIKYDNELIHIYTNYCSGFYASSVAYDSDFILSYYFKTFVSGCSDILITNVYSKNGESIEKFGIRLNMKAFNKVEKKEALITITKLFNHLKKHFKNKQTTNRSEVRYN